MVIPELYSSIIGLVEVIPKEVEAATYWINNFLADDTSTTAVFIRNFVSEQSEIFIKWVRDSFLSFANSSITSITVGVISAFTTAFNFFIGLLLSIYVILSKERFTAQAKKIVYSLLPLKRANTIIKTMRKSNEIFISFICGKLLEAVIIGFLIFLGSTILQIPYAMLMGVIIGVTNIIPFFGPWIGGIPCFIILFLQSPFSAIVFIIYLVILMQVDGNLIGPKILGDSTGLSPFWVIFAILVGGGLFGFVGLLFGVPTLAVIFYIIGQIVGRRLKKKDLPVQSDAYMNLDEINTKTGELDYFSPEEEPSNKKMFKGIKLKSKKPTQERDTTKATDNNDTTDS